MNDHDARIRRRCRGKQIEGAQKRRVSESRGGGQYPKSGDHEKAEKMYLEIISKGHAIDAVYSNLGVIYKNTGREKMAIDMYKKALKINPLFTGALCNLGIY